MDLSVTDLSATCHAYFRLVEATFRAHLSRGAGYQVPFNRATAKSHATIDVLGLVRDEAASCGRFSRYGESLRKTDDRSAKSSNTSRLELGPGTYHAKVVVREEPERAWVMRTDSWSDFPRDVVKTSSVVWDGLRSGAGRQTQSAGATATSSCQRHSRRVCLAASLFLVRGLRSRAGAG